MERILPVYVAIDCGSNMKGVPISRAVESIRAMLRRSREDPFLLEALRMCFVTVGKQTEFISPFELVSEIHGISVCLEELRAETGLFEKGIIEHFHTRKLDIRTEANICHYCPRVFWFSDNLRPDFVRQCESPYHWSRLGCLVWFFHVNCALDEVIAVMNQMSLWISNPYDDELLCPEDETCSEPGTFLPPPPTGLVF